MNSSAAITGKWIGVLSSNSFVGLHPLILKHQDRVPVVFSTFCCSPTPAVSPKFMNRMLSSGEAARSEHAFSENDSYDELPPPVIVVFEGYELVRLRSDAAALVL
jgi:hypothetical protein